MWKPRIAPAFIDDDDDDLFIRTSHSLLAELQVHQQKYHKYNKYKYYQYNESYTIFKSYI